MDRIIDGKLLCINDKYELIYKSGELIVKSRALQSLEFRYTVYSKFKSILSRLRLLERLLRLEARCAIALNTEVFLVSCHGMIIRIDMNDKSVFVEHRFVEGMNNPLSFCTRKKNGSVEVIYGEYGWNGDKNEVGIWKREDKEWIKINCFPKGQITHIHQIVYDQYRDEYLIATGDKDSESGIWVMDSEFLNIKPLVRGKQLYRTCAIFPTQEGFLYATDTPLTQNYLFLYSSTEKTIKKIAKMPGPCIYAIRSRETCYFSTSVEPDSSLNTYIYRLTYKLGAGVSDRYTHVFRYYNEKLEEICRFKKDNLPIWLFQFGNCQFASIEDGSDDVYLTPTAVRQYDNKTIKFRE